MSYRFPQYQRRRSPMVVNSMDFNFLNHGSYSYTKSVPSSGFVDKVQPATIPWNVEPATTIKKPSLVVEVNSASQWKNYFDGSNDNNKLLVVQFTATWCGPCRHMEPVMAEFAAKYTDVVFIKIDVDKLPVVIYTLVVFLSCDISKHWMTYKVCGLLCSLWLVSLMSR
ncbi:Thioredoxin H7 [Linum grandiflorum]